MGTWVVTIGNAPSEIIGPLSKDEADKLAKRLKTRARQLDSLYVASTIRVRALTDQSALPTLETLIYSAV